MAGKRIKRVLIVLLVVVLLLLALLAGGFGVYRMMGRAALQSHAAALQAEPMLPLQSDGSEQELSLEEGQIAYHNKIYEYNDDLLIFLCLGIDSRQDIQKEKIPGEGGQADTIILAVLDQNARTLKIINISRDTMTKIKMYDINGLYLYDEEAQLALQYAYGDGREKSCELMEQAVSNLFYGIPIHGYAAIDIKAVSQLNDAAGGVEVTVIEDLSRFTPELALGNTLTLTGRQALHYVQERQVETEELGANNLRIERQKQYLMAFFAKVKEGTKKDITLPVKLFNTASQHMITSFTADQAAYLSTIVLDCSFGEEDMISVQGTVGKEDVYEEFHVDEQALYDLIVNVFYREADL
ncbi:MAG: LCP family protein [Lachnospiraceae bacterium]|nr:LCP family protein [Lachnospiraceae bacterium]MCM1238721.1 LCP family protein [Lachnospiraceae bacterium]